MKKLKQVVSLLLVAVMCLGLLPAMAAPAGAGTITVKTTDTVTGQPLSNVTYKLENITAGHYADMGTATSGRDGETTFNTTYAGWYRITQVFVPQGYILNSNPIIRYIDPAVDSVQHIDMKNVAERALYVYRVAPATNEAVKGAQYEIKDNHDHVVATGTTDESGYFVVPHITAGEYSITELNAPDGFTDYQKTQNIRITNTDNSPYMVVFAGAAKNSITILNIDGATGEAIPGGKFQLTKAGSSSEVGYQLTTNSAGTAIKGNLEPGTYIITQTDVGSGYNKDLKTAQITVSDGENAVVTITNLKPAQITAYCADTTTGDALPGVKLTLYNQKNQVVKGPITADGVGKASFTGIEDGNYTVVAEPPAGYVMDTHMQSVTITKGRSAEVLFTATSKASLQITSSDAATGQRLPDTKFRITKMNGDIIGEYTTGSDGSILVPNLDDGYYVVEEIGVPAGYVMVQATQTVRVEKGKLAVVNFTNHAKPFILVEAHVKETNTPVSGCFFEVRNASGARVATGTTGADGTYTFTDLEPGVYTVNFSYAPEEYTIDTPSVTVTVTRERAGHAKFTVSKHSAILIQKMDAKMGGPLPGATFQIRNEQGRLLETVTTGADGFAVTDTFTPGRYFVQELFAPDGYVPDTTTQVVEVANNKASHAIFTNAAKTAIVVYAYDSQGNPISGVSFEVSSAITGKEVANIMTDSTGVAVLEKVEPGVYIVQESVIPNGFVLDTPIQSRVNVDTDLASYVRFIHTAKSVIHIQTADTKTGKAIPGAVYQVTVETTGELIGNFTTDDNGEVITGVLSPGRYLVKQIIAPSGYLLNTTTQTIAVDQDKVNQAKFFNTARTGIVVEAVSQHDHTPLAGCTFEIYGEDGKQIFHGTTTTTGILNTGELAPGKYTIKQVAKPDGYSIVQPIRTVEVTTKEPMVVVFENVALTSLHIELIDKETRKPLEGARFKVEQVDGDYVCELITDGNGEASVSEIPVGIYMVHQSEAPEGYILEGTYQWAKVVSSADTHLKFTNSKVSGLIIQCLELNGHKPLAGGVFEIYAENEKLINTFTSDTTGVVQAGKLKPGTYLVKEVAGPAGYTIQTAIQKVVITTNESSTLIFYHTANSNLTINKTDAETGKVLAGAKFRITKGNGDFVGDYTTNRAGQIVVPTLEPGQYTIFETRAPEGYLLDSTPKTITIKDNQPVIVDFVNDKVSGLTIINTCKQTGEPIRGNQFKIVTLSGQLIGNYTTGLGGRINIALEPGTYVVYQTYVIDGYVKNEEVWNTTIKANVGTTLEVQNEQESRIRVHVIDTESKKGIYNVEMEIQDAYNNYIGRFVTDNNGYVYLDKVLAAGRYKVTLLTVPSGYEKDTVSKTITVEVGRTTVLTWKLTGIKGQIRILTYAADDNLMMNIRKNTKISGATYEIRDITGKLIRTVQCDGSGNTYTGALEVGTYYIQQSVAPTGFMLNGQRLTLNVTNSNRDITIEVYNQSANYNMTINTNGSAVGYAGMQVKYYFTNIRSSSTTAMNNFSLHIKVPAEALIAGTFYTGTWNFSAAYSIQYKTNLRDYQILASGLNSKSQYSYDLSRLALGLGSDEYVTDIRVVFAGVPAGFHEAMAPTLYCTVKTTIPTGYQYTVRAEVAGQISGSWYTGASQHTGMTVNNLNFYPLPGTLPKTGY